MGNLSLLNSTNESRFTWMHIAEYSIFTVVFAISVVGNVLVCLVIFNTPRMRTTRNYLLVNLAVSDLTVALLCIPFDVVLKVSHPHWPLGAAMCNILWPAMTLVTNCSSFTLAAISLDRYRAVVHPWKPRFTSLQTAAIVGSTWSLSFILVLPYALVLKIQNDHCNEDWPHPGAVKVYTMALFVFQYTLPLLVITLAYIMVAKKLRVQSARIARNCQLTSIGTSVAENTNNHGRNVCLLQPASDVLSSSSPPDRRLSENCRKSSHCDPVKQELVPLSFEPSACNKTEIKRLARTTKIMKMLVTVVAFYAICLLPNQVVWLWYEFGSAQEWTHFQTFRTFGSVMVYLNSCVNPLLYAGMNDDFRKGFRKLLVCKWNFANVLV